MTEPSPVPDSELARRMVDLLPDAVLLVDANGAVARANAAAHRLLGCDPAGSPLVSHFDGPLRPVARRDPAHASHEFGRLAATGRTFEVRTLSAIEPGLDMVVLTPPRSAGLEVAEDTLLDVIRNTSGIVYQMDLDGNFLEVNERAYELLGYTVDELRSMNVAQLVPEGATAITMAQREGKLSGETPRTRYDLPLLARDGSVRVFEIDSWLITREGEPIGIQGIARDMTERARAEGELREREERLRALLDAVGAGVWLFDGGGVTFVNRRLTEITGYTREQLLATNFFGQLVHPDDREAVLERGRARVRGEAPDERYEMRIVRADGETRYLEVAAAFIDFAGRPCSLVSVFDITERKRQEQEEAEAQSRLLQTQKLESLGVLAGGIAHDFNNLLVGILGNADLALAELSPESTARDTVRDIQVTAQRAAELTRQMLAYSGKGRFVVEPIDISRLVEEMAHLLEVTAARRATLRLRGQANLPLVQADATQLRQVVMNLIMNASEAIGDRSGVISVSTGITYVDSDYAGTTEYTGPLPEGEYVHIEVADTGGGMDEATTTRIFEPFFTTKFTGRGLGLAAVLGIVRGHNGAIKVYSEVGRGTTFKVLLPALRSSQRSSETGERGATAAWRGAGRALLVDDDQTVRRVTARMLARAGFEALEAPDGDSAIALALADEAAITVVILDLTMPGLSGKDTFLALHRLLPGVPIVLTSGYNEQEATDDFAGRGLAGFLQKPFRYDDLAAMLRAVERG